MSGRRLRHLERSGESDANPEGLNEADRLEFWKGRRSLVIASSAGGNSSDDGETVLAFCMCVETTAAIPRSPNVPIRMVIVIQKVRFSFLAASWAASWAALRATSMFFASAGRMKPVGNLELSENRYVSRSSCYRFIRWNGNDGSFGAVSLLYLGKHWFWIDDQHGWERDIGNWRLNHLRKDGFRRSCGGSLNANSLNLFNLLAVHRWLAEFIPTIYALDDCANWQGLHAACDLSTGTTMWASDSCRFEPKPDRQPRYRIECHRSDRTWNGTPPSNQCSKGCKYSGPNCCGVRPGCMLTKLWRTTM